MGVGEGGGGAAGSEDMSSSPIVCDADFPTLKNLSFW